MENDLPSENQTWRAGKWTIEICDYPINTSIDRGLSITMFDFQRVTITLQTPIISINLEYYPITIGMKYGIIDNHFHEGIAPPSAHQHGAFPHTLSTFDQPTGGHICTYANLTW